MARRIDTQAVIDWIRTAVQGSDPAAPAATYDYLYTKASGLFLENSSGSVAGPLGMSFEPGGRLTLTSATPVTTADVTAAATLYYTPYKHDQISLYDGARWIPVTFTEKSLALGAYTASKPYDIWGYLSSGTLALESTIWTDGTTRATALAYQDGRLVKSGTTTRRYLGTIYINSSGGQTDDSVTKRFVWNYYNRIGSYLYKQDTNTHTYATAAWRYWNNDSTNIIQYMLGVNEVTPTVNLIAGVANSNAVGYLYVGIGLDNSTGISYHNVGVTASVTQIRAGISADIPCGLGYHFYSAVELSDGTYNNTAVDVTLRATITK